MFDLTFLGTAASTPSAERGLPALLVGAGTERFLIDCGEGTQRQLLRAGSGFRRIGHVLLTHAHLDHVLGLGGLIATLGLFDVRNPLRICGSRETLRFVQPYLATLYPLPRAPVPLQFVELQPGPILSSGDFAVTCFPVRHRGTESLGYRFDATPRRHLRADRLAAAAKVGALYLTHISGRYDPADIAAEAARSFRNVTVANDFDRVTVAAAARQPMP